MFGLGELEAEAMEQLWSSTDKLSVHDLVDRLGTSRQLAYTTVLTVVTHLHQKGWVEREKRQRAYFYYPSRTREEAVVSAVRALLDSIDDSAAVLELLGPTLTQAEFAALTRGWARRAS